MSAEVWNSLGLILGGLGHATVIPANFLKWNFRMAIGVNTTKTHISLFRSTSKGVDGAGHKALRVHRFVLPSIVGNGAVLVLRSLLSIHAGILQSIAKNRWSNVTEVLGKDRRGKIRDDHLLEDASYDLMRSFEVVECPALRKNQVWMFN